MQQPTIEKEKEPERFVKEKDDMPDEGKFIAPATIFAIFISIRSWFWTNN
jgi:hypothetical protein